MPSAPRVLAIAALLTVLAPLASVRDLQPLSTPSAIAPPAALVRALAAESRALQPGATDPAGLAARLVSAATALSLHIDATSPPGAWAPAVAALAAPGAAHAVVAAALVTDLYERLHARPDGRAVAGTGGIAPHTASAFTVDYPGAIAAPSPNYWWARRPSRTSIRYVVIHDTEAPCASALAWLTNRLSEASAHFIVCRDGRIYQLVRVTDAAWHAGNTYINYHSIGIEHEGYAGGPYTPAQYAATAGLLRWLNTHLNLHLQWTRNAVIGHENVPAADHVDPGTGWDWPRFMSLLTGSAPYLGGDANTAIVLARRAYVRACPAISCALLGTADWGEQFHVLARAAGWVKIDYAGAPSWVIGAVLGRGLGTAVHIVTTQATAVHAWPSAGSLTIGHLAIGQTYISTLIDDALDRKGWWFLEYANRYGYVCACGTRPSFKPAPSPRPTHIPRPAAAPTLPALPFSIPSPPATATRAHGETSMPSATRTARPSATGAARPTGTPISSPTAMLTPMPTATPMETPLPTDSPMAVVSASASPTAVGTPAAASPTVVDAPASASPTAVDAPTVTETVTETPTETATPVPTDTPSPTVAPTPPSTANLCRGRIC